MGDKIIKNADSLFYMCYCFLFVVSFHLVSVFHLFQPIFVYGAAILWDQILQLIDVVCI